MPRRPSAKRFAQAIFQLALERDEIEQWRSDLKAIDEALQEREFAFFLSMPKVRLAQKMGVIQEAFPSVNPLARNLLGLLTSRGRVDMVPFIQEEYGVLLDRHRGMERAQVVSAVALEEVQRERLVQHLQELVGKEIVLSAAVDPAIIGGLVARVGDRVIDGSTRTRLQLLRKSLVEAAL
ncbi:MAG: ATP synthase F1 subunit delta [Chloroflexi bacterium]|nr:ATP synthase F1 subunit delta [Chloroflexota bacterium]